MAKRPVFQVSEQLPRYSRVDMEFIYNSGFSVVQKQKNIAAIHAAYKKLCPGHEVLEISSKSLQPAGVKLSAFNLQKNVPSLGRSVAVENIYQAAKKFEQGGPYTDLLQVTAKEAKKDERIVSSGRVVAYVFEGVDYPIEPTNTFYDWLYITALMENEELASEIIKYDAFTDIEFNPEASLNCQARAAAVFVSLAREGLLGEARDFRRFMALTARGSAAE